MREKILTKRIAVCLLGILLCVAIAFCTLAMPARADEEPLDGRINEDFESITSIPKASPWILPSTSADTFFSPIATGYNLSSMTGIVEDPAAAEDDEEKNHALRLGLGGTSSSGCTDMFGTRSVTGFDKQFTVSFDFYFPSVLKSGDYFAQMFFGPSGAKNFGDGAGSMPYRIQAANGKNVLNSTGVLKFDDVELPLEQWFTVTFTVDAVNNKADLYWSAVNSETNEREYNPVVSDIALGDTWSAAAKKGLGYMRFGSVAMSYNASNPVVYYLDNLYVQPTYEPYLSNFTEDEAFRIVHAYILAKTTETLAVGDNAKIAAALESYEALAEDVQALLADEHTLLTNLSQYYEEYFTEDTVFKINYAEILAKTEETLLRSDKAVIAEAKAALNALEQTYKDKLTAESTKLDELETVYAQKYTVAISQNFESFEIGAQLPYEGETSQTMEAEIGRNENKTNAGTGVVQDPLAEEGTTNKVYRISGNAATETADTNGSGGIVSRTAANNEYKDRFTMRMSFYIPEVLREGERLTLTLSLYTSKGATVKKVFAIESEFTEIPPEEEGGTPTKEGKNIIRRGDYGSQNKDFFFTELPQDKWFDIIFEADKTDSRLSVFLEINGVRTLICNSPCGNSQLQNGLAYFYFTPEFATLTDENETPSAIYIDNMSAVPGLYLSSDELKTEIAAAKEEAQGYLQAIQKYFAPEQSEGDGEEGGEQGGENTGTNGGNVNVRAAATDYDASISGFDKAKSVSHLIKLLSDFKLQVNIDMFIPALDAYVTKVKTENTYSEAGSAAIDAIAAALKDSNSADAFNCARHGVAMRYTYYLEDGVAAVKEMYESVLAAIDEVPTAAEEVASAKAAAVAELDVYSADDYRDAEKELLSAAVNAGKEAVNAAETVEAVAAALANAKAAIGEIKTDAQLTAEEAAAALAAKKTEAKAELDAYKSEDDYRDAQKEELAQAIEDGKAAIDAATIEEEIATALANAKTAIDAIKTDAQLTEEENAAAAALAAAKTAAKAELAAYKNAADYRNAQKTELAAEISAGNTAIDAATTEKAVSTALALAKAKIDLIKTDAQLTAEGVPNEDNKSEEPPKEEENKGGGESDGGCGSEIFAGSYALVAFTLLAVCALCITFAQKKNRFGDKK